MIPKTTISTRILFRLNRRIDLGSRFSALTTTASVSEEEKNRGTGERKGAASSSTETKNPKPIVPHEFRNAFPEFLPLPNFEWRHPIREKVERLDMLKRRMNLDIPEFYVGSILAVTCSDPYAPKRMNRFVGICIERDQRGLMHTFQLRNVVDGIAVEVPYDMYNPLIQSIQVLRLEKRPDPHLLYLRDAMLEYSTYPFDMQAETLPPGTAVPVNMSKVKLKPPPWQKRWHLHELYGVDEMWDMYHDMYHYRRKRYQKSKLELFKKYDVLEQYRKDIPLEDQQKTYEEILEFEDRAQVNANRPVGKRLTTVGGVFKVSPTSNVVDSSKTKISHLSMGKTSDASIKATESSPPKPNSPSTAKKSTPKK